MTTWPTPNAAIGSERVVQNDIDSESAMKKAYSAVVAAAAGAHFAYLIFLPSGGFLALRWRRAIWWHIPSVCWGVGVVALHLPCPLTAAEEWARARAGLHPLPPTGFIGHYVAGVFLPPNRIRDAQMIGFLAAGVSWIALILQRRAARRRRVLP